MIALLAKRDKEIADLKQIKSDQANEIAQLQSANKKLDQELRATSEALRNANETIGVFRAQFSQIEATVKVTH